MTAHEVLQRGDCKVAWEYFETPRAPGAPIVWLHGFGMERSAMAGLAREVAARGVGATSIGLDLRGHGQTQVGGGLRVGEEGDRDEAYAYPEMRDDLLALLEGVAPGGAHLVGHSMGGQVALMAACLRPRAVRSLSLVGAGPCRPVTHEKERRSWERAAAAFEAGPSERVTAALASAAPSDDASLTPERLYGRARGAALARVVRGAFLRVEGNDAACAALATPTLLIAGDQDAGWLEPTRKLAALLPKAELVVVPGAGHLVHLERTALCADAIVAFLEARVV